MLQSWLFTLQSAWHNLLTSVSAGTVKSNGLVSRLVGQEELNYVSMPEEFIASWGRTLLREVSKIFCVGLVVFFWVELFFCCCGLFFFFSDVHFNSYWELLNSRTESQTYWSGFRNEFISWWEFLVPHLLLFPSLALLEWELSGFSRPGWLSVIFCEKGDCNCFSQSVSLWTSEH